MNSETMDFFEDSKKSNHPHCPKCNSYNFDFEIRMDVSIKGSRERLPYKFKLDKAHKIDKNSEFLCHDCKHTWNERLKNISALDGELKF